MDRKRILLCLAQMSPDGAEQRYVQEAFDSNWVAPLGPNVTAFEHDLEGFVGGNGRRVVALCSGTAAVHLSLKMLGVRPHDEVLVQSFTFCASANPVAYLGANPVFVDSEQDSWNIDPNVLEHAINARIAVTGRAPKAIIPVSLYGMPYDVDAVMAIADKYGIPFVEDAAEGFGSTYKGQKLGTFGQYGVLSFNGNKMITTSGGGALVCRNDEEYSRAMWLATQARESFPYYHHEAVGYNYRMSNVSAGIGRGQMTVAADHVSHHRRLHALYGELLAGVDGIRVHNNPSADYDSNFWLTTVLIDPQLHVKEQEKAYTQAVCGAVGGAAGVVHNSVTLVTDCQPNANVEALRLGLSAANVESRPLWKPMHLQPVFACNPAYITGISEELFRQGLCLPSGPCVSEDDVRYVVDCIKELVD